MSEAKPDQVVIITGATKGLGRALALTFARRAYHVVGLYHADQLASEEIRREFAIKHLRGEFIRRDVTQEENGEISPLIDLPESAHLTSNQQRLCHFRATTDALAEMGRFSRQF